jgi:hypothetical protein
MSKMFNKLNSQVKANSLKEKAVSFKTLKERKEFENKMIFGNLIESFDSLDIEKEYKDKKE